MNNKYNYINKVPIVFYHNAEKCKFNIFKENRERSGIYCWKNNLNGKIYIGSAKNLTKRLSEYFNPRFLNKSLLTKNSKIYSSLLKNGYSNFSLGILEYCKLDLLINKEQYYIDLMSPEYNILRIAGSMLGFKHSPETLLKFKYRKFTPEAIINMKKAKLGKIPSLLWRTSHLLSTGHITIIINKKDNSIKQYPSVRSAAKDLNAVHGSLKYCMKNNTLFRNTFLIVRLIRIKY